MALTVAPDFTDGPITAAKLQQLADAINQRTPLAGRKTSDQNVGPSNTTLQDVTECGLVVEANAVYAFGLYLQYSSNATADIKIGWSVPAGTTGDYGFSAFNTSGTWTVGRATFLSTAGFDGANTYASLEGSFITVDSGTVQFQAAQNTSTAVSTLVEAGTLFIAQRIA